MWHLRNQPLGISLFRLAEGRGGPEILMRSKEAQIGKRVRVRTDYRKTNLRTQEGTIAKRWGNPAFTALDVLLDDGNWQLFWHHELEEVDEDDRGARGQNGATAGH
jgi:hypothetical protein